MSFTNDVIADMLTRLRNASQVRKIDVLVPRTNLTLKLAQILNEEGFIHSFQKDQFDTTSYQFKIILKYFGKQKKPGFVNLERVSKPGCRIYTTSRQIPEVLGGIGVSIISTSQGLLTDRVARQRKLGGEILCDIY